MVGGIVKETLTMGDRIWVNVEHVTDTYRDECAIYVVQDETSLRIRPGDALWWQGRDAMWTPKENRAEECGHIEHVTCKARAGVDYDIAIPRIGYSGVRHPAQALIEAAFGKEG